MTASHPNQAKTFSIAQFIPQNLGQFQFIREIPEEIRKCCHCFQLIMETLYQIVLQPTPMFYGKNSSSLFQVLWNIS